MSAGDYAPSDTQTGAEDGSAGVSLRSLMVSDANGQPLSGYTYSSASEARYPLQAGSFVPEPTTELMALLALACIVLAGKVKARCFSGK